MRSLQVLNRRAIELKSRDAGEADARYRINFGLYFYSAASRETRRQCRCRRLD